jgi:hypothetical protein
MCYYKICRDINGLDILFFIRLDGQASLDDPLALPLDLLSPFALLITHTYLENTATTITIMTYDT